MALQNSMQQARSSPAPFTVAALADPQIKLIDGAAMDYFLIEAVNTLRASSLVATARAKKAEKEMIDAGLLPASTSTASAPTRKEAPSAVDSVSGLVSRSGAGKLSAEDDDDEPLRVRLEVIGRHVGANFTEQLCRDRTIFPETLDAIKFVCKDIWGAFWDKQVDNLRTNHRGVYVLQDNKFKPLSRISSWEGRQEAIKQSKIYTAMAAGIIRGALARLGFPGTIVVPEITSLPQCTFQVKLPKGA